MNTSKAEWTGILETLEETLQDVLCTLDISRKESIQPDVIALELFDIIDRYMSEVKGDLGL